MSVKNILVPIADGIEEIEAVSIIDVLRRAGLDVSVQSINELEVKGANGIKIVADKKLAGIKLDQFDAIVLPGGTEGAERFAANQVLCDALKKFAADKKWVAAICASPALVFSKIGLLDNKQATCYPSFKEKIINHVDEKVVVDQNVITSQGPGTALAFAFKLVELFRSKAASESLRKGMMAA